MTLACFLLDPAAVRVRFVVYKVALRHDCRRLLHFSPVSTIPARTSGRRLGTSKQRDVLITNSTAQKNFYSLPRRVVHFSRDMIHSQRPRLSNSIFL